LILIVQQLFDIKCIDEVEEASACNLPLILGLHWIF